MPLFYDIALDESGDLKIDTGDIEIGLSDEQHVKDILRFFPGAVRQYPYVGVGIIRYVESDDKDQELTKDAKSQLTADGYLINVFTPVRSAGKLHIDTDVSRP